MHFSTCISIHTYVQHKIMLTYIRRRRYAVIRRRCFYCAKIGIVLVGHNIHTYTRTTFCSLLLLRLQIFMNESFTSFTSSPAHSEPGNRAAAGYSINDGIYVVHSLLTHPCDISRCWSMEGIRCKLNFFKKQSIV